MKVDLMAILWILCPEIRLLETLSSSQTPLESFLKRGHKLVTMKVMLIFINRNHKKPLFSNHHAIKLEINNKKFVNDYINGNINDHFV